MAKPIVIEEKLRNILYPDGTKVAAILSSSGMELITGMFVLGATFQFAEAIQVILRFDNKLYLVYKHCGGIIISLSLTQETFIPEMSCIGIYLMFHVSVCLLPCQLF